MANDLTKQDALKQDTGFSIKQNENGEWVVYGNQSKYEYGVFPEKEGADKLLDEMEADKHIERLAASSVTADSFDDSQHYLCSGRNLTPMTIKLAEQLAARLGIEGTYPTVMFVGLVAFTLCTFKSEGTQAREGFLRSVVKNKSKLLASLASIDAGLPSLDFDDLPILSGVTDMPTHEFATRSIVRIKGYDNTLTVNASSFHELKAAIVVEEVKPNLFRIKAKKTTGNPVGVIDTLARSEFYSKLNEQLNKEDYTDRMLAVFQKMKGKISVFTLTGEPISRPPKASFTATGILIKGDRSNIDKMIDAACIYVIENTKQQENWKATSRIKASTETALIKGSESYQWFTYTGAKPYSLDFRGKPVALKKGDVFGVRWSSNGKQRRLILKSLGESKVFTLTDEDNKHLAKNSKEQ